MLMIKLLYSNAPEYDYVEFQVKEKRKKKYRIDTGLYEFKIT